MGRWHISISFPYCGQPNYRQVMKHSSSYLRHDCILLVLLMREALQTSLLNSSHTDKRLILNEPTRDHHLIVFWEVFYSNVHRSICTNCAMKSFSELTRILYTHAMYDDVLHEYLSHTIYNSMSIMIICITSYVVLSGYDPHKHCSNHHKARSHHVSRFICINIG